MIKEHDRIVLTCNLPKEGLKAGDVGTVVHIHKRGEAYEVEFVTLNGDTVAVATVLASQVRPVSRRDLTHARPLKLRA
jgi:ATP-dependent exoDNAse (exonuclease V) alpha subunit